MGTKKNISSLLGGLSTNKADGVSLTKHLTPGGLLPHAVANIVVRSAKPGTQKDSRALSLGSQVSHKGIQFGSPSSKTSGSSQGKTEWSSLLKQTTSGGLASAFGGGLLDFAGGIGGLIGSITHLFGGGAKEAAPLVQYQLPSTRDQSVSFASQSSVGKSASTGAIYGSTQPVKSSVQTSPAQTQQITQAVKQALLTSSSLNDVIAEI